MHLACLLASIDLEPVSQPVRLGSARPGPEKKVCFLAKVYLELMKKRRAKKQTDSHMKAREEWRNGSRASEPELG